MHEVELVAKADVFHRHQLEIERKRTEIKR